MLHRGRDPNVREKLTPGSRLNEFRLAFEQMAVSYFPDCSRSRHHTHAHTSEDLIESGECEEKGERGRLGSVEQKGKKRRERELLNFDTWMLSTSMSSPR